MRVTFDLPQEVYERVKRLAEERGQSLSVTLADLTSRGLAAREEPTASTDPVSGLPTLTLGQRLAAAEVEETLYDE